MNAKKAKQLRKQAKEITNGAFPDKHLLGLRGNKWDGAPTIQAINAPKSVRGVYRTLKKLGV